MACLTFGMQEKRGKKGKMSEILDCGVQGTASIKEQIQHDGIQLRFMLEGAQLLPASFRAAGDKREKAVMNR